MIKKKKCIYVGAIFLIVLVMCLILFTCLWYIKEGKLKSSPAYGVQKAGNVLSYQGKKYQYNDQLINILLLGVDKKGRLAEEHERGGAGQTDAVFFISMDTKKNDIKIFCIPRDSMVPVKRLDVDGNYYDTKTMQLSLQYAFGNGEKKSCELTTNAVANLLYQIPFSGYYALDLEAIRIINDAIGGVDITVNEDFTWYTDKFPAGSDVHLEGDNVMEYLQVRDTNKFSSSMSRIERQKGYIEALLPTAKKSLLKNPTLLFSLQKQLKQYMKTSFSTSDTGYLALKASSIINKKPEFYMIPGEIVQGDVFEEYHVDDEKLYQLIIEEFYKEVKEQ